MRESLSLILPGRIGAGEPGTLRLGSAAWQSAKIARRQTEEARMNGAMREAGSRISLPPVRALYVRSNSRAYLRVGVGLYATKRGSCAGGFDSWARWRIKVSSRTRKISASIVTLPLAVFDWLGAGTGGFNCDKKEL